MNIKNFCSDKCLASYQGISQVKSIESSLLKSMIILNCFCFLKIKCECGKSVLKEDCCFVRAKWYCSEACALGILPKEEKENISKD